MGTLNTKIATEYQSFMFSQPLINYATYSENKCAILILSVILNLSWFKNISEN